MIMSTNPPPKPAPRRETLLGGEIEIGPRGYRVVKPAPSKADRYVAQAHQPEGRRVIPVSPPPVSPLSRPAEGTSVWCVGGCCDGLPEPGRGVIVTYSAAPEENRAAPGWHLNQPAELVQWSTGEPGRREWMPRNWLSLVDPTAPVAIGTALHQWAEGFRFGHDVVSDPPCLDDAEPLAVDAIRPAVVDVLNAITARLEQLRDGGHPARRDGVTEGEQAAWRAGLNRAIGITSSSALIAAGVGQARRGGA
jgi:hypothetical protein